MICVRNVLLLCLIILCTIGSEKSTSRNIMSKKANLVPISLLIFFDVNSYQFSGETIKASKNTEAGLAPHVGIIQLYHLITHITKTIVRKALLGPNHV